MRSGTIRNPNEFTILKQNAKMNAHDSNGMKRERIKKKYNKNENENYV